MSSSVQIIEALNRSSFTRRHFAFYMTIVFCHFFDGFDIQMMGFTLPGIVGEFRLTPGQAGFLASSVFTGMLLGGIIVGTLADSIGRKNALIFAIVTYGLMGLCAGFAPSYGPSSPSVSCRASGLGLKCRWCSPISRSFCRRGAVAC
jgi:MFS family permease